MPMIKVTLSTEDGEVLDQFKVLEGDEITTVMVADAVRDLIEQVFEVEDVE